MNIDTEPIRGEVLVVSAHSSPLGVLVFDERVNEAFSYGA